MWRTLPSLRSIRFYGLKNPTTLRGYTRPVLRRNSRLHPAARGHQVDSRSSQATTDANGDFRGASDSLAGDYRARIVRGHGFVAGGRPHASGGTGVSRLVPRDPLPPRSPRPARRRLRARRRHPKEQLGFTGAPLTASRSGPAGGSRPLGPSPSSWNAPSARGLAAIRGVAWVERIRATRRLAFTSADPLRFAKPVSRSRARVRRVDGRALAHQRASRDHRLRHRR